MREPQITSKIVAALNAVEGCFAKKRHSGTFGGGGEPDISGCYMGYSFLIEVKMLDGELTKLQAAALERWKKARAQTFLATYNEKTKVLKISPDPEGGTWLDMAGPGLVKTDYYEEQVGTLELLSKFKFEDWLIDNVRLGGS